MQVNALPMQYEDSTHQLWDCNTKQGPLILKICNSNNATQSHFWLAMKQLFGVDLPKQLGDFEQVYNKLTGFSQLTIPNYIASGSITQNEKAFIIVNKVAGTMATVDDVDDGMVIQLANHIATLHQQTQVRWGLFSQAEFEAERWSQRLRDSLILLAEQRGDIPTDILADAIEIIGKCEVATFVPIMPDLRWDQFLQQEGKLSALVDLDAFVFGPKELELVLLEYLLDDQQARVFASQYQQIHALVDLSQVRQPYRLLLFMMNVLGEQDIDLWMQAPTRF